MVYEALQLEGEVVELCRGQTRDLRELDEPLYALEVAYGGDGSERPGPAVQRQQGSQRPIA